MVAANIAPRSVPLPGREGYNTNSLVIAGTKSPPLTVDTPTDWTIRWLGADLTVSKYGSLYGSNLSCSRFD